MFDRIAGQEDSSGDGCQVSSWLISFPCIFPLCWQGAEGTTLSMLYREKELRSASQWFLRIEPLTYCWKLSISNSESPNMALLIYPAQMPSHMYTPASLPSQSSIWPFSIPRNHLSLTLIDLRWVLSMRHLKIKPIGRTNGPSRLLRSWWEVLGTKGSFVKLYHQRAVFELSISYSFVYFTCSLTV